MRKKVLVVTQHLDCGGIETFLYNLYNQIDLNKIQMDFFTTDSEYMFYEEKLKDKGAQIYTTPYIIGVKNKILFFKKIYKLLKVNKYDAIHVNMDFFNAIPLLAAYFAKIPIRISHSHNTNSASGKKSEASIIKKVYRIIMKHLINKLSNVKLGCSNDANVFMYGEKVVKNGDAKVIFNAIDIDKFKNNSTEKSSIKNNNRINFITVGRMCTQKNSFFIAEIINELSKIRKDIHLHWVGVGGMEEEIKKYVSNNNIENYISFLGKRDDVNELLKNMDFMLFPSKWEGLGIVLIEAQIANVPCFISDTIPKEADLGLCTEISLKNDAKKWAEIIHECIKNNSYKSNLNNNKVKNFDMKFIAKEMEDIYCKL